MSNAAPPEILRLTAFAAEPGGGNPAGVVLDASALTDAEMQAIATEVAYPETAFVVDPGVDGDDRHVRLRYFSPGAEVPFCGHATIATAVALAERRGGGRFTLETNVGPLVVETASDADADADTNGGTRSITASFTSVEPTERELDAEVADRLLSLLGLERSDLDERWPLRESFAGNRHPVVAVREQEVFDAFTFDPTALRTLMDEQGWAGTATVVHDHGLDADGHLLVEARNLFPVGAITDGSGDRLSSRLPRRLPAGARSPRPAGSDPHPAGPPRRCTQPADGRRPGNRRHHRDGDGPADRVNNRSRGSFNHSGVT